MIILKKNRPRCLDNCIHFKDTYSKILNERYICDIDGHIIQPSDLCCRKYKNTGKSKPFGRYL